jgi:hypothetical protein
MLRLASILAFAFLLLAPASAFAEEPSAADKTALRAVVQGQLDAFQHDDGVAAYSFAAPGIQAIFKTPDAFIGMVRQAYPPIYRPRSVAYGQILDSPLGIVQKVFVTGPDGTSWVALYRFEKQKDGSWKISACQLLKDTAETI